MVLIYPSTFSWTAILPTLKPGPTWTVTSISARLQLQPGRIWSTHCTWKSFCSKNSRKSMHTPDLWTPTPYNCWVPMAARNKKGAIYLLELGLMFPTTSFQALSPLKRHGCHPSTKVKASYTIFWHSRHGFVWKKGALKPDGSAVTHPYMPWRTHCHFLEAHAC